MNSHAASIVRFPTESLQSDQSNAGVAIAPKFKFVRARDGRGRDVGGLWVRNKRFYYQVSIPGKSCRRVPLVDEENQPVKSIQQAKNAMEEWRRKKRDGEVQHSGRTPCFNEYVIHYLDWVRQAKKSKTLLLERSMLNGWVKFFGGTRLNQIMQRDINRYALQRKNEGVGNRTVNLAVLVLGNLFRFAKREAAFSGRLPTEGWEPLEYRPPKRQLLTREEIDHFCDVAVSKQEDGTPRFLNGEMLADAVRFMSVCGARVASAFAVRWSDVDWERRQLHLTRETKYSKAMVVDFNEELEKLLKEMYSRRQPDTDAVFPGNRSGKSESVGPLRKTFEMVCAAANLPKFKFHSLRVYFISTCVMAKIDLLTIASWVGHADTVLIGRVYGHLNDSHKKQEAQKLVFNSRTEQSNLNTGTLIDVSKMTAAELFQLMQQKIQNENGQAQASGIKGRVKG
jgi:integrase